MSKKKIRSRVVLPDGIEVALGVGRQFIVKTPPALKKLKPVVERLVKVATRQAQTSLETCGEPDHRIPLLRAVAQVLGTGAKIILSKDDEPKFIAGRVY